VHYPGVGSFSLISATVFSVNGITFWSDPAAVTYSVTTDLMSPPSANLSLISPINFLALNFAYKLVFLVFVFV